MFVKVENDKTSDELDEYKNLRALEERENEKSQELGELLFPATKFFTIFHIYSRKSAQRIGE